MQSGSTWPSLATAEQLLLTLTGDDNSCCITGFVCLSWLYIYLPLSLSLSLCLCLCLSPSLSPHSPFPPISLFSVLTEHRSFVSVCMCLSVSQLPLLLSLSILLSVTSMRLAQSNRHKTKLTLTYLSMWMMKKNKGLRWGKTLNWVSAKQWTNRNKETYATSHAHTKHSQGNGSRQAWKQWIRSREVMKMWRRVTVRLGRRFLSWYIKHNLRSLITIWPALDGPLAHLQKFGSHTMKLWDNLPVGFTAVR